MKIEVIKINDFLTYFFWGRHAADPMLDMRLGGGSFALHRGQKAVVIDTMARPGQGVWVKRYLQQEIGISHFTLISSHWHIDHIIDNEAYQNDTMIIGHRYTREKMLEKRSVLEGGNYGDYPPFKVVPPHLVFDDRLTLWLGDLEIELLTFQVHEAGHLGIWLPQERLFIANDILEDPLWFVDCDFAPPAVQLAELEQLKRLGAETLIPCHGNPEVIRRGGYGPELIQANIDYLSGMLADLDKPDFMTKPAEAYLGPALASGVITWWEPYREVHAINQASLLQGKR